MTANQAIILVPVISGAFSVLAVILTNRFLRRRSEAEIEVELHGQDDSFILKGSKQLVDSLQTDHRRIREQNERLEARLSNIENRHTECLDRLDKITTDHAAIVAWIRESVRRRSEHEVLFPDFPPSPDRLPGTEGQ